MNLAGMKIITKIILSFIIVLAMSIMTIGFLVYGLKGAENKMKELYGIFIISNNSAEIGKIFNELSTNLNDCIFGLEKENMSDFNTLITIIDGFTSTNMNLMKDNLKILNEWISEKEEKDFLAQVEKRYDSLSDVYKDVMNKVEQKDTEGAAQIMNDLNTEIKEYSTRLIQMSAVIKITANDTYLFVRNSISRIQIISLIVSIVLIFISILIAVLISKNISKSLLFFKEIFIKGAKGDLEARYPVKEKNRDEINELGTHFNGFMDEVQGVIKEVVDVSNDLSVSSDELSVTLNNFAENSQNQAASSEEITATMEEISAGVDNVSENSQTQAGKLNELVNRMNDLSVMINEMADMITNAQGLSKNISDEATVGSKSIDLMNTSMSTITESSNKVTDIVGIIDDISNRINLLSLNAAIEAARAGEAGRGFAVVADEISKLADQTATSINDINSLIKKNIEEIDNGMKNVGNTYDSMKRIINGVDSIYNMMNNIFMNMKKQQTTNETVNKSASELKIMSDEVRNSTTEQKVAVAETMKSITNINDIIQSSASGAEEMTANASRLASMADSLKGKVGFFHN